MNKIEVDPRLFITCRLCLEELGVYQIAPIVKEQILYCFDINVEPFDGLPQLVCKKCEAILSNFAVTKKKFVEKQNDLRTKIKEAQNVQTKKSQYEPDPLDSIENLENNGVSVGIIKKKITVSSSDLEYDRVCKQNANVHHRDEEKPDLWAEKFTKHYVCRICNSQWLTIKSLQNHASVHKTLLKKYDHIFKRHCEVKLCSSDGKQNIAGSKRRVMHNRNKIIENVDPNYYVTYTSKYYDDKESTDEDDGIELRTKRKPARKIYESSCSSEDDIIVKKSKRVRRICSRSSNETVILETTYQPNTSDDKESKDIQVGECINIDDSTDSDSETPGTLLKTKKNIQGLESLTMEIEPDQTTINEIINSCQNKYVKKHYLDDSLTNSKDPSDLAKQLKRKILSIGRKVINKKKGMSCTPLMRFMELKNLDIAWVPRSTHVANQESNCIRIMARMRNIGENVDSETGWVDYTSSPYFTQKSGISNTNKVSNLLKELTSDKVLSTVSNRTPPEIPQILTQANVLVDANLNGVDSKKLLNENPVANPKQLPKKPASEMKAVAVTASKPSSVSVEITPQETDDFEMCMPFITSTTSLATSIPVEGNCNVSINGIENATSINVGQRSEVPRIKVKPASELMSAETLNRMHEPNQIIIPHVQNDNHVIIDYGSQMIPVSQVQNAVITHINHGLVTEVPASKDEYMVLDTIDMPVTKTNSPFTYLKNLLQMHNILLLNTDAELPPEYNCLIKFKVLYKQESNSQPVILCLALYCFNNIFCMKVKDRNQENINLTRISPNWQWEVLKIYKGEVVDKLLLNAKKIGQEVFEFTNSFVCLLKSIKQMKV